MPRIFRELCEDAVLSDGRFDIRTEKKYFGKIVTTFSEGKKNGHSYITVSTKEDLFGNPDAQKRLSEEIKRSFSYYFRKLRVSEQAKVLVVCLGNEKITADSLGSKVAEKLIVTSHVYSKEGLKGRYGNLCALKCGVSGVTGIESYDMIVGTIRQIRPDMVVAVDTLACSSVSRLGCTVQFSDGGIEPGGGVGNAKKSLTHDTLKVPVLAVGVPLVIYASRILSEYSLGKIKTDDAIKDLVVAAREIDFLCRDYADVIADAINGVVHNISL